MAIMTISVGSYELQRSPILLQLIFISWKIRPKENSPPGKFLPRKIDDFRWNMEHLFQFDMCGSFAKCEKNTLIILHFLVEIEG
jgi:hypothetical protein